MEQLNRIELRGNVGNIKIQVANDKSMARFSLATSKAYVGKNGEPVIETTWHNVVAFEGKNIQGLERLSKGSKVYVTGRMRNQRYTGLDGVERNASDVLASRVNILDDSDSLDCEM